MGTSDRTPIVVMRLTYVGIKTISEMTLIEKIEELYLRLPWTKNNLPVDLSTAVIGFQSKYDYGKVDIHLDLAVDVSSTQEAAFEAMILRISADFADALEELCDEFAMHVDVSYLAKQLNFYNRT